MNMETQVKAEDIIVAIVENMRQGLEPLLYTAWAPSLYHVYLRSRDFERLHGIFPAIVDEAKIALDQEIEHLNGEDKPSGFWGLLGGNFKKEQTKQYLKPKEDWNISFHIDDDLPDTENCRVEALLVMPPTPEFGAGNQTIRVSTLRGAGEMKTNRIPETLLGRSPEKAEDKAEEKAEEKPPAKIEAKAEEKPATRPAERVYARISYEDKSGPQTFQMKKNQIAVGRGGVDYWVDLRLDAKPDVSHEHLRVRCDEATGQFFIKDLSKFGTTVNGSKIPCSIEMVNGHKQDRNVWTPLPPRARIGLADVLFLDFEAVEEK